ncbi:hypothetical protein [Agromyces sp. SYSU T00194]|uniref:hypothetical protein n=1 Tax=Agromyces chitinivorans TaxID=3158560 RepID=UPI003399864C
MSSIEDRALAERIAELEAENARLRASIAEVPDDTGAAAVKRRPTGRARTAFAVVLLVLGVLLAPIAVLGGWAKAQLVDTDQFVATFAPLAEDPQVQAYVSDQVTEVVLEQVDVAGLTASVFDGVRALEIPDAAKQALTLLEGPAVQGIENLVGTIVDRLVASDAFEEVFATALRASHTQFVAAMQGDPNAALTIGSSGEVGIQLAPVIAAVKERLVDAGVGFAASIPEVDRTIVVAQSDALVTVQIVYALAVSAGTWLPWVVIGLLALGVVAARNRPRTLFWTGLGLAVSLGFLAGGFGVARLYFLATVSPSLMPLGAAEAVYDQIVDRMAATAVALALFGVAIAVIAWFAGGSETAGRLRDLAAAGFGGIRRAALARGVSTGGFGRWLDGQVLLVRVAVLVIGAATVLFTRPVTVGLVVATVVIVLVVLALVELLRLPEEDVLAVEGAAVEGAAVEGAAVEGAADEVEEVVVEEVVVEERDAADDAPVTGADAR